MPESENSPLNWGFVLGLKTELRVSGNNKVSYGEELSSDFKEWRSLYLSSVDILKRKQSSVSHIHSCSGFIHNAG